METNEEIKYPIFLFENANEDVVSNWQLVGKYASIEELNQSVEPWLAKENGFTAYDSIGKLLNLTTEWKKVPEKGLLFNTNIVTREFIKLSIENKIIIKDELLKKFLQINLLDTIEYIKQMLVNYNIKSAELLNNNNILFKKILKNIQTDFILSLNFADTDSKVILKFKFLKQLILNFIDNILKNNLILTMSLDDLTNLADILWDKK